tara:strand:- start:1901 stop:2326 length:426 start_codon:yes stop_codon:yes gene_type:complete
MARLSIFFLFFFFITGKKVLTSEIIFFVKNITDNSGFIHVALYNDPMMFPKGDGKLLGFKKKTSNVLKEGILIKDLEMGRYAIAIFHDENNNDKFDTFLGIPKEKFGFSNNVKVFLGPPKFSEASFFLSDNIKLKMEIELK